MGSVTCRGCEGRGKIWLEKSRKWVEHKACDGSGINRNLWSTKCERCRMEIVYKANGTTPKFCRDCRNIQVEKRCSQHGCDNTIRFNVGSNSSDYCGRCRSMREKGASARYCSGSSGLFGGTCGKLIWVPSGKNFDKCMDCNTREQKARNDKWKEKTCLGCSRTIKYNTDWSDVPNYCKDCGNKELEKPCSIRGCDRKVKYKPTWKNIPDKCGRCHKETEAGNTPRLCDNCQKVMFNRPGKNFTKCRDCNQDEQYDKHQALRRAISGRHISAHASSIGQFAQGLMSYVNSSDDMYFVELGGPARETWRMPPLKRGEQVDRGFDRGNLPFNFPTIDLWEESSGEVTSIKSIDLGAKTYHSTNTLDRQIAHYIDQLAAYQGDKVVDRNKLKRKVLLLVAPLIGARDYQINYLASIGHGYARDRGVQVVVFIVD